MLVLSVVTARAEPATARVAKAADKLYNDLTQKGIEVLYDDRPDASAGQKFADSDLIGIPKRIVVSPKTLSNDSVEIKMRNNEIAEIIKINNI